MSTNLVQQTAKSVVPSSGRNRYSRADKWLARQWVINIYRWASGCFSLPPGRTYGTLCGNQNYPGSEVDQFLGCGVIGAGQYHGVDESATIIENNRRNFPRLHFHQGDWLHIIRTYDWFGRCALTYLDTTALVYHDTALALVQGTLRLSRADNMIFANVMLNNWRSTEYDSGDDFPARVISGLETTFATRWQPEVLTYQYKNGITQMRTYAFIPKSFKEIHFE